MRAFQKKHVPKPKHGLQVYPDSPVDLEIGCGVGLHAITYCQKYPKRNVIAVDRSRLRIHKMKKTIESIGGLPNLVVVCEDADKFVVHEIKEQSIENLFLLYPNPYPKEKQANKRWHQMPLMSCLLDKLVKGGTVHLVTNMEFYAAEAKKYFMEVWKLQVEHEKIFQHQLPFAPRTHFEKKYLERGDMLFDMRFKKTYSVDSQE